MSYSTQIHIANCIAQTSVMKQIQNLCKDKDIDGGKMDDDDGDGDDDDDDDDDNDDDDNDHDDHDDHDDDVNNDIDDGEVDLSCWLCW